MNFTLFFAAPELHRGWSLVAPKLFKLFALLLEQRHRVVSRNMHFDCVWSRNHLSMGVVTRRLHKHRLILDLPGQRHSSIKGMRAVGYPFVVGAELRGRSTEISLPGQPETTPVASATCRRLHEPLQEQIQRGDLEGLGRTLIQLRAAAEGSNTRHRLVVVDLFQSHVARMQDDGNVWL